MFILVALGDTNHNGYFPGWHICSWNIAHHLCATLSHERTGITWRKSNLKTVVFFLYNICVSVRQGNVYKGRKFRFKKIPKINHKHRLWPLWWNAHHMQRRQISKEHSEPQLGYFILPSSTTCHNGIRKRYNMATVHDYQCYQETKEYALTKLRMPSPNI